MAGIFIAPPIASPQIAARAAFSTTMARASASGSANEETIVFYKEGIMFRRALGQCFRNGYLRPHELSEIVQYGGKALAALGPGEGIGRPAHERGEAERRGLRARDPSRSMLCPEPGQLRRGSRSSVEAARPSRAMRRDRRPRPCSRRPRRRHGWRGGRPACRLTRRPWLWPGQACSAARMPRRALRPRLALTGTRAAAQAEAAFWWLWTIAFTLGRVL